MKKNVLYIVISLILLLFLWSIVRFMTNKVGNYMNEFYELFGKQNSELFLKDVDFSDGKYVLYIKHKEFGEFAVTDEKKLENNRDSLKVKTSLINYLPGEGNRSFGVMLFKNNKLIKTITGGVFNTFKIGGLKEGGHSIKKHRFLGAKREVTDKIDSLKLDKYSYITVQPNIPKEGKEFHFRIYFPSIAVPVTREKDDTGYEIIKTVNGINYSEWINRKDNIFNKKWKAHIEKCIRNKAKNIIDFDISISKGTVGDAYIFNASQDSGEELRNANKQILYLKDFMYYQYDVYIGANKDNAQKLIEINYSDCIVENDRNKSKVIAKMKQLVKQSTNSNLSVDKGEVGLSNYRDSTTKSKKLYEQEYQLNWLEVIK